MQTRFWHNPTESGEPPGQSVRRWLVVLLSVCLVAASNGCGDVLQKPPTNTFYGEVTPAATEFRWSNGAHLPRTIDPIFAAAAPETDLTRALYAGLTDLDETATGANPAIAVRWETSPDSRIWTFYLRRDARWTNGKPITAADFVRSWRRAAEHGSKIPHHELLANIVGAKEIAAATAAAAAAAALTTVNDDKGKPVVEVESDKDQPEVLNNPNKDEVAPQNKPQTTKTEDSAAVKNQESALSRPAQTPAGAKNTEPVDFGVEAAEDFVLRVKLIRPDKDFAALVAHPVFRPVAADSGFSTKLAENLKIVTSGAFRLTAVTDDALTLERSGQYWETSKNTVEQVRLMRHKNAEAALDAYRAGTVDAVTNTNFEPLTVKLLSSYQDFRRATHNAVQLYEFNPNSPLFKNRRVREALCVAIDRERLVRDEMNGAAVAATDFLPTSQGKPFVHDAKRAQNLLTEAGFKNAENFPKIRLVINRNESQRRVARRVAEMWRKSLNVETEIIVREANELDRIKISGDYDLIRRTVVLPTISETNNLAILFPPNVTSLATPTTDAAQTRVTSTAEAAASPGVASSSPRIPQTVEVPPKNPPAADDLIAADASEANSDGGIVNGEVAVADAVKSSEITVVILTEEQALAELAAIPLYYPSSFALIKPYVSGFDINLLDAPLLNRIEIEPEWQTAQK